MRRALTLHAVQPYTDVYDVEYWLRNLQKRIGRMPNRCAVMLLVLWTQLLKKMRKPPVGSVGSSVTILSPI